MEPINPFFNIDGKPKHIGPRGFEYVKGLDKEFMDTVKLPTRKTSCSAGYDFMCPFFTVVEPGDKVAIKTGIKAYMLSNEYLAIHIRSSMAIKHNLMLVNNVGIIDSDYYSNPDNDGEIIICVTNIGNEPYEIGQGEYFAQGIFCEYMTDDNVVRAERTGGIGSTGK